MMQLLQKGYDLLVRVGDSLQPVVLLVFRLTWGWQFFVTGRGKLLHHGDITEFFASLGIPAPGLNAWFVGGLECVGGLLLMAGLGSRPIGLLLAINMSVAYLSVPDERAKVFNIFKELDPFLYADPFFFLLTAILVFTFGPGMFSLDNIIKRFVLQKSQEPTVAPASQETPAG